MKRFALVLAAAAFLAPAADSARYAVGARSVADLPALRSALGTGTESLAPLPALIVERAAPPRLADLPGATYVERLGSRRLAFVPTDSLVQRQWHLPANRAFDFWETPPLLPPVRVAVIDSGIDGEHPELVDKIVGAKSFVGGSARVDRAGHGTFVAGLIAAGIDDVGIAGMAPSAELLVAKVVNDDDLIDVEAEVKAIKWAVANGAGVINMSLGGLRDPRDPGRDAYSALEAAAIGWAHGKGVVIVAAVGNSTDDPPRAWPFASYPAALPHVLGVSALTRDGSVPTFSHRDRIYNDISAPGHGIVSTLPLALTVESKECPDQGYSSCGPEDFRKGQGTSFAAPQVSAAAAVLLAVRPKLRPEQVTALLTQSAQDVNPATGCRICPFRRDALSGWGRLDVTAALRGLSGELPPRDRFEPNDDAGDDAAPLWGTVKRFEATLDFWDDQNDVYAIRLRRGQPVYASVRGPAGTDTNLILWLPGTRHVDDLASTVPGRSAVRSARGEGEALVPGTDDGYLLRPGQARLARRGEVQARDRQGLEGLAKERLSCRAALLAQAASVAPIATAIGAPCVLPRNEHRTPATSAIPPNPPSSAYWFSSSSSSGTSRSCRAGLPTMTARGGTSFVTTAPAPMNASAPISIAGQRIAPPPMRAPRRIVGPLTLPNRCSVRPIQLSFVVTTQGAMKTCSSSVE